MSKEAVFLGIPEEFQEKFLIFPPKIKELVSNKNFNQYRQLLTFSQEELDDEFLKKGSTSPTPLEFLLSNSYHNKDFEKIAKDAFYFFIHQDVTFLYEKKLILVGDLEKELKRVKDPNKLVFIGEDNYFAFQNKIRESLGEKPIEPPNPNEHPKIRRMKALARYRDKIKAKQGGGINLITSLASICCMGIGITPLNIGEMSYASIGTLINTYQNKEKYAIDIASIQAGADSKKINPKYWIKNLE
jgi:hypothetical protein